MTPDISLMKAKIVTIVGLAGSSSATWRVKKSVTGLDSPVMAILPAFTMIMPRPSNRTMASIVYAGRNLLPEKRENSAGLRGCLTWRTTMSTRMPRKVAMPSSSSSRW
ncbi:hypothetical protein TSOC111612_22780 [Tsukamurella ocularis]